jgi:predicted nucleic acid-binding protein
MPLVVDSSIALARAAPDEMLPAALRERIETDQCVVPALWPFEVMNGLEMMRRRKRIDLRIHADAIEVLGLLSVEIEQSSLEHVAHRIAPLAQTHGLTIYDATYLELAQRRRLPLATLDTALKAAAQKIKVSVL